MSIPTKASVSTFITNLRLLNFDQLDDWPDVDLGLFAIRNARENQKQRIRCVEWALYKLFTLWSPKEAKNKLQPFFPPYESLRSLNLRAALLRCLTELKKDGVLGKEIVIRKTMFDECRGDKFEDLLAFFSTIVLQKVLRLREGNNRSIVGKIVTAPVMHQRDQKSLLPLAVAHQGALEALLRRKALLKSRYAELKSTLNGKERELLENIDNLAQADQDWEVEVVSERAAQDIQQRFETNWHGNTKWAKSILEGDREDFSDPLLDTPFSTLWTHTENGTLRGGANMESQGLLQDLTSRVHAQQDRLRHWQQVQQSLIQSHPKSPIKLRSPVKRYVGDSPFGSKGIGSPLKFGNYNRNGFNDVSTESQISRELKLRYCELLDLHRYPSKAKNPGSPLTPIPSVHRLDRYTPGMKELSADVKSGNNLSGSSQITPSATILEGSTYCETQLGTGEPSSRPPTDIGDHTPVPAASKSMSAHDPETGNKSSEQIAILNQQIAPESIPQAADPPFSSPTAAGRSSTENDDILAQQIITSALSDEPSPIKQHNTSLMERTRLSMASSSITDRRLLPDIDIDPYTPARPTTTAHHHHHHLQQHQQPATTMLPLVERTRRSISLLPTTATANAPRSRRPTNRFETPRKRLDDLEESRIEEMDALVSPEADYQSVFMSRPRVANSPGLD
ncbi:MAG: hypothetical protein Q9202_006735 [Teloschistes flavicans]